MRKLTYFAVFESSANGSYGVYFPNLPGCISLGDDFQHAQTMATEALGLHIWGMEKDNEVIPNPTFPPFKDIPEGSIVVPITIFPEVVKHEIENKSEKTNVTLPTWLKKLAEKEGINFSQLLQVAIKEYLGIK
jgi:predicted RNase H-like HicB family nuclease